MGAAGIKTSDNASFFITSDRELRLLFLLNIGTLAASMLMMLGPSYLITKIDPAKSIRFE